MIKELSSRLDALARRLVPHPLTAAILLTALAFALALFRQDFDVRRVMNAWISGDGRGYGVWNLLRFGMQICLLMLTTHALVESPPGARLLAWITGRLSGNTRVLIWVSVASILAGWVHWALALLGGALLAKSCGLRAKETGVPVHYPLLATAGFSGLMVWHCGLSGSVPYRVSTLAKQSYVLGDALAAKVGVIPRSTTLGAHSNVAVALVLLAVVPWLIWRMNPDPPEPRDRVVEPEANGTTGTTGTTEKDAIAEAPMGLGEHLNRSRSVVLGLALLAGVAYVLVVFRHGIVLNVFNFLGLFLGLAAHGSVGAYLDCVKKAAPSFVEVALVFPLFSGIMGLAMGCDLAGLFVPILQGAGATLLPAMGFYVAGVGNLLLPSGGGEWVSLGKPFMEAALQAHVPPVQMVMAFVYGEQWSNLISPFWVLPALAITGVPFRKMVGYGLVLMAVAQLFFLAALYL